MKKGLLNPKEAEEGGGVISGWELGHSLKTSMYLAVKNIMKSTFFFKIAIKTVNFVHEHPSLTFIISFLMQDNSNYFTANLFY